MATTTNYSWTTPDNTAYVKDGASAIRTLGSSVDTTLFTALGGAYPGLRLVKKQTIGSAVSSVVVTGAFSAAYENYKIIVSGGIGGPAVLSLKLDNSATGYYNILINGGSWATPTPAGSSTNNGSAWSFAGWADANNAFVECDLFSPFAAKFTGIRNAYMGGSNAGQVSGQHQVAVSHTGFTLSPNAGTLTGGTIYVYGYGAS